MKFTNIPFSMFEIDESLEDFIELEERFEYLQIIFVFFLN